MDPGPRLRQSYRHLSLSSWQIFSVWKVKFGEKLRWDQCWLIDITPSLEKWRRRSHWTWPVQYGSPGEFSSTQVRSSPIYLSCHLPTDRDWRGDPEKFLSSSVGNGLGWLRYDHRCFIHCKLGRLPGARQASDQPQRDKWPEGMKWWSKFWEGEMRWE